MGFISTFLFMSDVWRSSGGKAYLFFAPFQVYVKSPSSLYMSHPFLPALQSDTSLVFMASLTHFSVVLSPFLSPFSLGDV